MSVSISGEDRALDRGWGVGIGLGSGVVLGTGRRTELVGRDSGRDSGGGLRRWGL